MPEHATVRSRTAPAHPRRVSGPSRRPALAGAAIPHRGRTGAFEKLSRIPDHRVVDRLLRGRACIWVIGLMLGGIVAMQVSLLRLNAGISRAVQTQGTLTLQNAGLQSDIAQLTTGERVTTAAAGGSMIDPPAGQTRYLTAHPATDPARAAKRMKPPSERAKAIMANGGMLPGALAPPGTTAATLNTGTPPAGTATTTPPATTSTAPPAGTATTTPPATTSTAPPVATPIATATAIPTPVATATAVPTAPPVTTAPGTGAAPAPDG
jgi:hypothetical protein